MRYLDLTLSAVEYNLALDEALLLEAEAGEGGEVLRTWEWRQPAVVLGAGCRLAEDVDEAACADDGVPILRRSSGGGTVLLGEGCLLYTLVLRFDRSGALAAIQSSYSYILDRVGRALGASGPVPAGVSDLALAGRKCSGNAQQRKRDYLLHHGTLLYAFDVRNVGRYLRSPKRAPEYRAGREHADFLVNLESSAADLKRRLQSAWQANEVLSTWPQDRVRQLVEEKYGSPAWIRRR
jgi:lipoate-protein ligase A